MYFGFAFDNPAPLVPDGGNHVYDGSLRTQLANESIGGTQNMQKLKTLNAMIHNGKLQYEEVADCAESISCSPAYGEVED